MKWCMERVLIVGLMTHCFNFKFSVATVEHVACVATSVWSKNTYIQLIA